MTPRQVRRSRIPNASIEPDRDCLLHGIDPLDGANVPVEDLFFIPAVVIPVAMQHYMLLQRNLIYTGITRAKRLLVVIGQTKALGIAVRNDQSRKRYSGLLSSLNNHEAIQLR